MQEGINQQQRSVNEPPDTKTAKRKAFGDTGLPLSQVKSVDSEYPQKHGQNHCDQSVLLGGWIQVCSVHGFFLENKIPICRTWAGSGGWACRPVALQTSLLPRPQSPVTSQVAAYRCYVEQKTCEFRGTTQTT